VITNEAITGLEGHGCNQSRFISARGGENFAEYHEGLSPKSHSFGTLRTGDNTPDFVPTPIDTAVR
jgi:hypothetical protein